ncbi:hypothetical protein EVA_21681, partial [gut metagenome]
FYKNKRCVKSCDVFRCRFDNKSDKHIIVGGMFGK